MCFLLTQTLYDSYNMGHSMVHIILIIMAGPYNNLFDGIVLTSANWSSFSTKVILEGLPHGFRYDKKSFDMENEWIFGKVYSNFRIDFHADF